VSMDLVASEQLARRALALPLPRRWSHVQGVARQAENVGGSQLLVSAAWLHDIGYAPALVDTGFHPVDGARYLRRNGIDERIVSLVAHHSCAYIERDLRGLPASIAAEFLRHPDLPHDELCYCDLTTGPDGEQVTVEQRLAEIRKRYPDGDVVRRFIDVAEDEMVATVRLVERRLASRQPR
jgi:hypothetical protein